MTILGLHVSLIALVGTAAYCLVLGSLWLAVLRAPVLPPGYPEFELDGVDRRDDYFDGDLAWPDRNQHRGEAA